MANELGGYMSVICQNAKVIRSCGARIVDEPNRILKYCTFRARLFISTFNPYIYSLMMQYEMV